jgi:hypothetical protein
MQATILLHGDCPVCGYRNEGVQVGSLRPGMRIARLQAESIGWVPPSCEECRAPMHPHLYDRGALDAETTAKLKAWQERQRAKRQQRRAS